MQQTSLRAIADAIGAEYTGPDAMIDHISTDSRELEGSCLFVALEGERVDGHSYIETVLKRPNTWAVAHKPVSGDPDRILMVKDTFPVLMDIARAYRKRFSIRGVGVTGSVGKTTTKEFIAAVMERGFRTLKSEGNHNNEIGLPKTVFQLDDSYEAAVLEMGMDGLGDISRLTSILHPDIGVITSIGVSHLEMLGSRENILKAKLEITEGMPDGAPLLLCGDNDLLRTVRDPRLKVIFYGIENEDCTIRARDICEADGRTTFTICHEGKEYPAVIPTIGRHNVCNALAAYGVGRCMEIPVPEILSALQDYKPSGMRQHMVDCAGMTVVEDCYNASPDSMEAALSAFSTYPVRGRRICVLADMLELGSIFREAHQAVGRSAAEKGMDILFTFGEGGKLCGESAASAGLTDCRHFDTREALADALALEARPGDVIWVKGSRGMKLEEVLRRFYDSKKD